jgi:hypothetical protein
MLYAKNGALPIFKIAISLSIGVSEVNDGLAFQNFFDIPRK